jgi:hypothetical protein
MELTQDGGRWKALAVLNIRNLLPQLVAGRLSDFRTVTNRNLLHDKELRDMSFPLRIIRAFN